MVVPVWSAESGSLPYSDLLGIVLLRRRGVATSPGIGKNPWVKQVLLPHRETPDQVACSRFQWRKELPALARGLSTTAQQAIAVLLARLNRAAQRAKE